ncbi:N-acetyl-L,L-diaminopimelate deacetylase [Serinicoccus hydrothermalis]|uniref:N-acetyl-L,L-diaminopimelate deacetylase n=1 Tax=Serinicoccus hydrothermalis TaxID=1758689 RepID=A0A1B1N9C6_9MICO|nr:M20 family metallopeptidase [Serinicoccus hydrothermalis]ANS78011.1 N-acetyl-L,L-diaminopimelate deacetylase [Serinicoccus hydrothermalis]
MTSTSALPDFPSEARALADDLTALRRGLHQTPELGNDLPQTQARVLAALDGLPLEITTGTALTSIVAVLRGANPGPTVLLRGDMDALPVAEETGHDFASTNGNMHACGHDLHTAGLVGAARLLAAHQNELAGNIVFMFQPGEEGPGGAAPMIAEGVLDAAGARIDAAYGVHVLPGEPGVFGTRRGAILAGANELRITFHGAGGHGSQPHRALDPVPPLLEFCQALQVMISRRFDVFDPVVASITNLSAGDAINVIPASASMGASVRTLSQGTTEAFPRYAAELAQSVAAGHGCTAEVDWKSLYPPTINDPGEADFALATLRTVFGEDRAVETKDPLMGSEDFSYVLQNAPGAFYFFQVSPPEIDPQTAAFNHSPHVLFDDAHLADQAASLAALAFARTVRDV